MTLPIHRSRHRLWGACLLAALAVAAAAPRTARAQTSLNADAGLEHYYKSQRWFPLRVNLTHQGQPGKVEVRARFTQGLESAGDYRIPAHELRSGANEQQTIYVRAPMSYSSQPLLVELYRDGRLLTPVRPTLNLVNDGDWLVLGIGGDNSALKQLTTVNLTADMAAPSSNPWQRGQTPKVNVAIQDPKDVPDQWQGLQAADIVVLGNVSERDLSPEQATALRDYVTTGGTLVITGGTNWNRLGTPFFSGLLPVTITGGTTLGAAGGLSPLAGGSSPAGRYPATVGRPKPGSKILASEGGTPLVVKGGKGSGQVIYLAFDPSAPSFRNWDGNDAFWKSILLQKRTTSLVSAVSDRDASEQFGGYNPGSGQLRLADAPYAIPQLDIPAFYIVAVFLLAYIVVLVPVNYFVLKAKDKKEYAWLTTPAIVLVFSIGAYMIGYGFKGGRTLVVKAGLVETYAGQDSAASLFYAGLFSPRKTSYDVKLASASAAGSDSATLFSQPGLNRGGPPLRSVQGDTSYIEDFAVDMWAMRVAKAEGVVHLKDGITATVDEKTKNVTGTVRNGSPYSLDDCYVVSSSWVARVGAVAAGQQATINSPTLAGSRGGGFLPSVLLDQVKGTREDVRMKRAVLEPLCTSSTMPGGSMPNTSDRLLVGWVKDPINTLDVNGHEPRELAATLMIVHLDR
jgi:hypothetical protein